MKEDIRRVLLAMAWASFAFCTLMTLFVMFVVDPEPYSTVEYRSAIFLATLLVLSAVCLAVRALMLVDLWTEWTVFRLRAWVALADLLFWWARWLSWTAVGLKKLSHLADDKANTTYCQIVAEDMLRYHHKEYLDK